LVAAIRSKLADPLLRKGTHAEDFAALEAFYAVRAGRPVWMTDMGFSAKGQQALFEVEKADDWCLDHLAFELPLAGELPASPEAQAVAEIKLDLAILKYAWFARGGRLNPREVSELFDQMSTLRDPKTVLSEIKRRIRPTPTFDPCIPNTSSSCACAKPCSRPAVRTKRAPGLRATSATSGDLSSIWNVGVGCRRILARFTSGAIRPSS
jgi:hypothetical protein